tara:strand:+ start:320 stop:610 length:291 start_codon:yes stop_codon:yes gene_type:complete
VNIDEALRKSDNTLKDNVSKPKSNSVSRLRISRRNNYNLSTKKYRQRIGKKQPKKLTVWYDDGYEQGRRVTTLTDYLKGSTMVDPYYATTTGTQIN